MYTKYYKYKKQVSYDGVTWEDVVPEEYVPSGGPIGYYGTLEECIAQYRTIQSGTTCVGVDKHNQDVYEVSYDNGVTWEVVSTSAGTLIEADSPDCGYVPPSEVKYKLTLNDSSTVSAECDTTSSITESEVSTPYKSTLVSAVIGNCVTSIGWETFENCSSLSSITIPNSITIIWNDAFYNCTSLTSITIPDSVIAINGYAFDNCRSLTSITVNATTPPGLGADVFDNTNNCPIYVPCASVDAYKSATNWSTYASRIQGIPPCGQPTFEGKYKLTLSNSSTASAECDSTSSITYNEVSVNYSNTLVSAEIGDCVTNISNYSFFNCSSLTSVTIPNSVTSIETAFISCSGLTNIDIPNSVTSIGGYAFEQCTSLSSCTIGSGVTSIGDRAFYYCSGLTSIDIPSGVTSIGQSAFNNCSSLASITVNAVVPPVLGNYAFDNTNNCPIYVPASSVNAYKSASGWSSYASRIQCNEPVFNGKFKLTLNDNTIVTKDCDVSSAITSGETTEYSATTVAAKIGDCVLLIYYNVFSGCTSLTSVTMSDSVTNICSGAFNGCRGLTNIAIPNSVTEIGSSAFYNCTSLTTINIPNSVTSIGAGAFTYCSNLTSISIPSNIKSIKNGTFFSCTSLTSVTIPNSVTSIENSAFRYCTGLTSVTIPSGVTTIGNIAFERCRGLASIIVNATTPPTLGSGTFDYTNNCPIYVPASSVNAYKSASGWNSYSSRITAIP